MAWGYVVFIPVCVDMKCAHLLCNLCAKISGLSKRRQKWRKSCCQIHVVSTRMEMYVSTLKEMNKLQLHRLKYGCTNPKRSRSSGPSAFPCLSETCWCKRCWGYDGLCVVSVGKHKNIPLRIGYSSDGDVLLVQVVPHVTLYRTRN